MIASVVDEASHANNGGFDHSTLLEHGAETLVARWNVLAWDDTALDLVHELVVTLFQGLDEALETRPN